MPPFDASTLIPEASPLLRALLRGADGPLQPPIRSEIFGLQRFAQHGRSLGETHRAGSASAGEGLFFPRLRNNIRTLRAAHRYIGAQASSGYDISPAAEWLLDNFHLIESQLKEIHEGLPRSYFRTLPVLLDEPLAGLPRIYGVAWAFVAHTDGAFDEALLAQFLGAYQETRELKLSEMWALPTTLRVVLIENLRRLAERLAANKAARETANLCCDRLDSLSVPDLDRLLAMLTRRGAGREFLGQMALRLQDRRTPSPSRNPTPYLDWLSRSLPDPAALQAQQSADQAADNLSVSNAVTSLRALGDAQWPDIIARTSRLMLLMLTSPAFEQEHTATRDQTLHGIERLARQWRLSELMVAQTLLDLMREEPVDSGMLTEAARGATHWIRGAGRPELLRALGVPAHSFAFATWRRTTWARHLALPAYLGALGLGSLGLVAWMLLRFWPDAGVAPPPAGWLAVTAVLMLFPASEAMVAVINRLVSESARPQRLPRLALVRGIPQDHRVMVVIPAMLGSSSGVTALVHRLELHFLANPERHAQFALLSDWNDAAAADAPDDAPLLAQAQAEIRAPQCTPSGHGRRWPFASRSAALHRAASPAPLQRDRAGLDRLGAQARQAGATRRRSGAGPHGGLPRAGRAVPYRVRHPLRRHARQRHTAAPGSPARTRRRGSPSAQSAMPGPEWADGDQRLRHPAAACPHALALAPRGHGLPLAVCRAVRGRSLQRRHFRGVPGSLRRGFLQRQGTVARGRSARGHGWPPAGRAGAQPRPAGRRDGALCGGVGHHRGGRCPPSRPMWPPPVCTAGCVATGSCCPSFCRPLAMRSVASIAGSSSTICAARSWRRCRWPCWCCPCVVSRFRPGPSWHSCWEPSLRAH